MQKISVHKVLDILGWLLLIVSILILRFLERYVDNIIFAKKFIIQYGIYGALFAFTILYALYKFVPSYFKSSEEKRYSAISGYFFGITIITLFLSSFFNIRNTNVTEKIQAVVFKKSMNYRYKTKYLRLDINGHKERFTLTNKEWNAIKEDDTITLKTCKGPLGYRYILAFNKP